MERVYLMPRRHSLFGWRLAAASPSAPRECSALAQTPESEPLPSTAPRQVTEMSLSVASPQLRRNHWNSLAASSGVEPQDEIQRGDGQDFSLSSLPGAQQLDLVRAAQKDDYYCRQLMLLTAGLLKSLSGLLSTSSGVPGSVFSWQSFSGSPEAIFGPTGGYGAAPLQHPDRAIDSQELLAGAFSLSSSTASPGIALPATETLPFSFPQQTREIQRGRAEQSVLVPAGTKPIAQPSQEIRPREGMRHDVQDGQVASVRASGQRRFPKCASSRECSPGHIVAHLRRWAHLISSGLQTDTMCLVSGKALLIDWLRYFRGALPILVRNGVAVVYRFGGSCSARLRVACHLALTRHREWLEAVICAVYFCCCYSKRKQSLGEEYCDLIMLRGRRSVGSRRVVR